MAHIFISYSRADSEYVDSLVKSLSQANFNVWLDRKDIQAGQNWRAEIVEAIERADSFVLVVSRSSTASKYVRQEVYVADGSDREISSLYMEPLDLPSELKLPLAGLQIILLYEDWNAGYYKLVDMLRKQQDEEQAKIKAPLPSTRQAELSIHADKQNDEKEKEKIFTLLSSILGIALDPAQIIEESLGKITINIPYKLSYELKAQVLNNNPKLWDAGITGLHFEGDKHHIPLHDPKLNNSSYKGKETQQSISKSSTTIPKTKSKLPLIIGGVLISVIFLLAFGGIYLFNSNSPPPIVPPTSINTPLPDSPTLTSTPKREVPPTAEAPTSMPTFTPSPTATWTLTPSKTATITPTVTAIPGKISGQVWNDSDKNGSRGFGEFLISGVTVSLGLGSCDSFVDFMDTASTATGSPTSNYSFSGLPAEIYCLRVNLAEACEDFDGNLRILTTPKMHTITLLPGAHESISFGSTLAICIP
ncbi:MAG: TIR domain-containing protein [Chloroflexi bacterium]|nr:TIR domain-containing protein [Chloroflexota bacterium]